MTVEFVFKGDQSYFEFHPVFVKEYSSSHRDKLEPYFISFADDLGLGF